MIKLVGDGKVLINEFETEDEGIKYMSDNKEELIWYYSRYELVVPGEKTIWSVSENLISAEEYQKKIDEKAQYNREHKTVKEEDWDD